MTHSLFFLVKKKYTHDTNANNRKRQLDEQIAQDRARLRALELQREQLGRGSESSPS